MRAYARPPARRPAQDEALEAYNALLELQAVRYEGESARLAVARGECFKLVGDVYVAKRQFNRWLPNFRCDCSANVTDLASNSACELIGHGRLQAGGASAIALGVHNVVQSACASASMQARAMSP